MFTTWYLIVFLCLAPGICAIKEDAYRLDISTGHTSFERCMRERARIEAIELPNGSRFRGTCIETDYGPRRRAP